MRACTRVRVRVREHACAWCQGAEEARSLPPALGRTGAGSQGRAAPAPRGPSVTTLNNQLRMCVKRGHKPALSEAGISPRPLPYVSVPIPLH